MKKLTLSVRESTIDTAKRLASADGISVSAMFERIVLLLDSQKNRRPANVGSVTRALTGLITLPNAQADPNGRETLEAALLEIHELTP